jgi:SNF2 family DNA or RNA helicase
MRITYRDGIYIAISKYEERAALLQAGFSFHPGSLECKAGPSACPACKTGLGKGWWTRRAEAAVRLSRFVDEKAKNKLSQHVEAVQLSWATDASIEIPHPEGREFRPYQKAGIAFMIRREASILGDEPGLGKTAQVIGVINLDLSIKNVFVVCPANLRINWQREANMWLAKDERNWRFHIVDEDVAIPDHANFVISNYNRITIIRKPCHVCGGEARKEFVCPTCNGTGNGERHPILCGTCGGKKHVYCAECKGRGKLPGSNIKIVDSVMARQWDLLAVDEAHAIKNEDAARTQAILGNAYRKKPGIAHRSSRRIFMTGTPMPNRPVEMWPILANCNPKEFGNRRFFVKRYCAAHEEFVSAKKKVLKVDGASNLEELQERLRSTVMVRRLKRDVLKELPPKVRQVVPLVPTAAAKKLIAEEIEIWETKFGGDLNVAQEQLAIAEETQDKTEYQNVVEKLKYIQKVAFMEMAQVRHNVAVAKIPSVIEHLKEKFDGGVDKIICFAHHKDVINAIADKFGERAVSLFGDTKKEDRQSAIDRFQTDKRVKLFIGGIMAAGTGLTLTAASHVVFAELDWTPSNVTQAEDRAHRLGQANSVLVEHLVLDGSLDARMAQMLVEKQEIADKALDNPTEIGTVKLLFESRPDVPVEPVPLWKKMLLKTAMVTLAERRDPKVEGSHGFSSFDATIGQKLATWRGDYSDKQAALALTFSKKYRKQLSEDLQKQIGVYEPPKAADLRKANFGKKPEQSVIDMMTRRQAS